MKRFFKDWAPLLAFFPALSYGILGNLQMYNVLPTEHDDDSFMHAEMRLLLVWMILIFTNFNSFVITLCVVLCVLAPIYWIYMLKLVETLHLVETEKTSLKVDLVEYTMLMCIMLLFVLMHTYMHVKEISMLAIKHHLLSDSSSLLKDFLENSFNATLILNEDDQILLSNQKADQIL